MKTGLEHFNELVEIFSKLPGVGKKSALRFAYFCAVENSFAGLRLAHAIEDAARLTRRCVQCGALSEYELCEVCADDLREQDVICVVQNPKDILTLEETKAHLGLYFVLDELDENGIDRLREMVLKVGAKELVFAFTPGLSSDGAMLFIESKLEDLGLKFTKIAQGVPTGVSLENVDTLSLLKAMNDRRKI